MSADIVGSTAYKASKTDNFTPEWAQIFGSFFDAFPSLLSSAYESLDDEYFKQAKNLKAWKFSGDEILFSVELNDYVDALSHLAAFMKVLDDYPKNNWLAKSIPLRLKGTAWVAGFPVMNAVINSTDFPEDYIGPSMDTGFRLAKFATPRKLVVSIELAHILLNSAFEIHKEHLFTPKLDGRSRR